MIDMSKNDRGSIVVFVAILLPVLIGFIGVSIDGGLLVYHKAMLSEATEAAAKSALLMSYDRDLWEEQRILYVDDDVARANTSRVLKSNFEKASIKSFSVVNNRQVVLVAQATVEFSFMRIFGFDSKEITDKRLFTISTK